MATLHSSIAGAQSSSRPPVSGTISIASTVSLTSPISENAVPTGPYLTNLGRTTLGSLAGSQAASASLAANGTDGSPSVTFLTGAQPGTTLAGNSSITLSATASSTTASEPPPQNTQPCNNYPEFCTRKYSNITMVAAHNSPFVRPGNAASNQNLPVEDQLNDGVRFVQAQIQFPTNASAPGGPGPHFCHTSCDILDAGPIADWLGRVKAWVAAHPYDVVTVLLGNGNYSDPALYAPHIEASGLVQYAYVPPVFPMRLDDWPTLAEMILTGKRVVLFLDYMADQARFPYLLDQFSQMWETPFDPVDRTFPCVVQRPPDLPDDEARARLYMANHNLNAEVNLNVGGQKVSILVPATSLLNETNNATGFGSAGAAAAGCRDKWGRAPNFLNVDYYDAGGFPGSVFAAAAAMNGVTYSRPCCGGTKNAGVRMTGGGPAKVLAVVAAAIAVSLAF